MLVTRGSSVRFAIALVILLGLSLWLAIGAAAKFGLRLSVSQSQPHVGQPVSVLIRTGPVGTGACRMRLLAVAPGINRYHALDAFIIGGYSVNGPFGSTFHRLRPTRRMGFLAHLRRSSPTTWWATLKFHRRGRWQLVVPNWCAPGYATPLPAVRFVTVPPISPQDFGATKPIRAGALAIQVPPGFHRYDLRGGYYPTGSRPPLVGRVVTNYRATNGPMSPFAKWSQVREPPPAKKVALALTLWLGLGVPPPARLHLPLSLGQPWFHEHLPGGAPGYRWGFLSFHKKLYEVFFWSGRAAPPHDRTSVLRALTSIRPAS